MRDDERKYTTRSSTFVRRMYQQASGNTWSEGDEEVYSNYVSYADMPSAGGEYPFLRELETDVFNTFYRGKDAGIIKEPGEFFEEYSANHAFVNQFFQVADIKDQLPRTQGNIPASVVATEQVRLALNGLTPGCLEAVREGQRAAGKAREDRETLEQMLQAYKAGCEAGLPKQMMDEYKEEGAKARAKAMESAAAAQTALSEMNNKMDHATNGMTAKRLENGLILSQTNRLKAQEVSDTIDGICALQQKFDECSTNNPTNEDSDGLAFGGMGQGSEAGGDYERTLEELRDIKEMAQFLGDSHYARKTLFDVIGRMVEIYKDVKPTRIASKAGEVVDVTSGRDLSNLTSTEKLRYMSDDRGMNDMFLSRYVNRSLSTWKKEYEVPQGKGSVIYVLDSSGSMRTSSRTKKKVDCNTWGVALGYALYHVACERRQSLTAMHFSSVMNDVSEFECDNTAEDLKKVNYWARQFPGGGTNYRCVFPELLKVVEAAPSRYENADVVFVTDGICSDNILETEAYKKFRTKYPDVKILGLLIHKDTPSSDRYEKVFEFCDALWQLDASLPKDATEKALGEMFQEIASFKGKGTKKEAK